MDRRPPPEKAIPTWGFYVIGGFVLLLGLTVFAISRHSADRENRPSQTTAPATPERTLVPDSEIRQRGPSPLYSESARRQWTQGQE